MGSFRSSHLPSRHPDSSRLALWVGVVFSLSAPCFLGAQIDSSAHVLTLRDVLSTALARHPVAGAALARVRGARGARTTAGAFGNPVLSYGVENARFPGGEAVPGLQRETMTTAMLPLESIIQRWPRARRADAELRAVEADAIGARQQLAFAATRAYFGTALAQVRIDVARDLTAWLDSVVTYNTTRVDEGVAAESDLIRAELERDRSAAQLALYEAEHARARAELAAFLGDVAGGVPDIVVRIDDAPMALPPSRAESSAAAGDSEHGTSMVFVDADLARRDPASSVVRPSPPGSERGATSF